MPILNYTTKINASKTVGEIQDILAKNGASKIMIEYKNSMPTAISFQIDTPYGIQSVQLPSNVDGVIKAMKNDGIKAEEKRGYDVAWRICKNWIEAQMAFINAMQAEMSQVFLPYTVREDGKTVYEVFQQNSQTLIGDARIE